MFFPSQLIEMYIIFFDSLFSPLHLSQVVAFCGHFLKLCNLIVQVKTIASRSTPFCFYLMFLNIISFEIWEGSKELVCVCMCVSCEWKRWTSASISLSEQQQVRTLKHGLSSTCVCSVSTILMLWPSNYWFIFNNKRTFKSTCDMNA